MSEIEVRAILTRWMSEHIAQEHEERLKYQGGPSVHQARAEAHARAALALHRALDAEDLSG